MNSWKPLQSVLVKPAGPDCNMACEYCFYLDKEKLWQNVRKHRMSDEVLENLIRQVMRQCGTSISFGWQGGEPTLMGLDFFQKVVSLQQKYGRGQNVGNGLQTNGLLLDEAWAKFLRDYHFLVGLSIDGPEHVHNRYRHLRGGQGSWQTVVDRARMLLENGVAVNALSVVNNYSVQFPEEIYHFHKSLGFEFMQFIPCVERDPVDPQKAASFSVSAKDYGPFLCKLFDLWLQDFRDGSPTTSIRFFDSVFYSYVGMEPPECTLLPECGIYVVVEHNGDVFSCDFFVEDQWRLGNILEHQISDLLNSAQQRRFGKVKAVLPPECVECPWLTHCFGGCPKDRLRDPADRGSNHFCLSFKMFFEHADKQLRILAQKWLHEHSSIRQSERGQEIGRNQPCPCGSGLKYKQCCGK